VETLAVHGVAGGRDARARAVALLADVSLPDPGTLIDAYPHQLSGGMQQRAVIALALACNPALLIADEPTTALDVTTQAQVLALLAGLRERRGLALLLVTHDLAVAAHLAHRVAVMYAGHIIEEAPAAALLATPAHPYTQALLASVPHGAPRHRLPTIGGAVPDPGARPTGCRFLPRCPVALDACQQEVPLTAARGGRWARCMRPEWPREGTGAGSATCR
jgi:oligopeptide/dipeptide ABC transporter ATP-binding protein